MLGCSAGMCALLLLADLATAAAAAAAAAAIPAATCSFTIYNATGCTAAGAYSTVSNLKTPGDCCAACSRNASCASWSFHGTESACYLSDRPKMATNPGTAQTTCGCRLPGCPAPQTPPPPPCEPVVRPPKSKRAPLPPGVKTQPHIVTVLVDDLGFADASIRGDSQSFSQCPGAKCVTPHMASLRKEGILLDRHHTYLWCSPTRRSFLTGRFQVHCPGARPANPGTPALLCLSSDCRPGSVSWTTCRCTSPGPRRRPVPT